MFGGLRITPTVRILLIINVAVFAVQSLLSPEIKYLLALYYYQVPEFMPFQIITHIFVHANFSHILHNMLPLLFLAPLIEQYIGSKRFLQLYLICGLGASALYAGVQHYEMQQMQNEAVYIMQEPTPEGLDEFIMKNRPSIYYMAPEVGRFVNQDFANNPNNESYKNEAKEIVKQLTQAEMSIPLMGASGAVFGLLMTFMLLFPNLELMLLFFPFPVKSKYLIGLYGLYEAYSLFQNNPNDNVAHLAHLGGMLFAYIMIKLVWKMRKIH